MLVLLMVYQIRQKMSMPGRTCTLKVLMVHEQILLSLALLLSNVCSAICLWCLFRLTTDVCCVGFSNSSRPCNVGFSSGLLCSNVPFHCESIIRFLRQAHVVQFSHSSPGSLKHPQKMSSWEAYANRSGVQLQSVNVKTTEWPPPFCHLCVSAYINLACTDQQDSINTLSGLLQASWPWSCSWQGCCAVMQQSEGCKIPLFRLWAARSPEVPCKLPVSKGDWVQSASQTHTRGSQTKAAYFCQALCGWYAQEVTLTHVNTSVYKAPTCSDMKELNCIQAPFEV